MAWSGECLIIDGSSLTMEELERFMRNRELQVELSSEAAERVSHYRSAVDNWLHTEQKVIYGVTTGLGKLKDYVVSGAVQSEFQQRILRSHAVGLGPAFPDSVVRLAMLLRANVLARGHSGVSVAFIERLLELLNKGVIPVVPQIGSLGVGDLQPMAHIGLCLIGAPEGKAHYNGSVASSAEQLEKAGISPVPFELGAKEVLALIDGSTMVLAATAAAYFKARALSLIADQAAALTMEALRAELKALDPRIHEANNLPAQVETADRLRAALSGSGWTTDEGRQRVGEQKPRVQDAVSIRSTAQVHGAIKDVLLYARSVIERELNASKDNPLLFEVDGQFEALSGGNFHGAHLSYVLDFMGIVMTDLAVISERRSARMLDPALSHGIPANLAGGEVGLNTGFALVHANATALVGEMRILAAPASTGSIPAKSSQEEHNSMAMGGVRKLMQLLEHADMVLAIELLAASQAIGLLEESMTGLPLGAGTSRLYADIRSRIEPMREDRFILADLERLIDYVRQELPALLSTDGIVKI